MKKGAWANIPSKSQSQGTELLQALFRNQVERFFNKIKHCRPIATRTRCSMRR